VRRQIAFLGAAILICYTALFVKFNQLQVFQAGALNDRPENSRSLQRDFNEPRGSIVTADGVLAA
jgi:peptidoglycan glycosyltransferase